MSVLHGPGYLITYDESEITCPICSQVFDASDKIDKAKLPVFNTKCPFCKGKITISMPIFGGQTECWETNCPKTVERLKTVTPDRVNGRIVEDPPPYDTDNGEDDDDEEDDDPVLPRKPLKRL